MLLHWPAPALLCKRMNEGERKESARRRGERAHNGRLGSEGEEECDCLR